MSDLRDQLQATLGDAYTIERELGGGGMSRVFVATEHALGRKVVVKGLPSEMSGQVALDRFKREISLAAGLQHPHIVPLLTAGASEGLPFFTMPYVKGESLRAQIAQRGELPVNEATRVLREVASALAFAHDAGVVHRDIKPDNVLLSGGSAMVTDFGVAKAVSASTTAGASGLTSLGVALVTPAYMSPEQASADPMVDHRADLYSWGILAYELLTGSTPFSGRSAAAMLAAHTIESAESIARRRPGIPPALAALVMKCLEKRASDRPQNAGEIVRAIDDMVTPSGGLAPTRAVPSRRRTLVTAGVVVAVSSALAFTGYGAMSRARGADTVARTIAVLPFENRSRDSTYDYLADGMSDELRSALNGVSGLTVKARSSSAALRGKSARDAGAKLDVAVVLEGSLSRSGERMRVTAELVRVDDENTIWSGSFDRLATELPAVQDSIIRAINAVLRVRDGASVSASGTVGARGTTDVEAYDLFLRGEFFRRRFEIPSAVASLNQAVKKDPSFARAHASLASAYALLPLTGVTLPDSARRQAEKSVQRALTLAPSLPAVYIAQALLQIFGDFQYGAAERTIRKAIELDSADAEAITWHAFSFGYLGHLDQAIAEARRAVRLDPLSTDAQVLIQAMAMYQRRYPDLMTATRAVLDIDPKSTIALGNLAQGYALEGRADSAGFVADAMLKIDGTSYGVRGQIMFAYAAAGRWKDFDEQRRLALASGGNSPDYYKAVSAILTGDHETALASVERGVRAHEPLWNSIWIACEPMFAPLRTQPRFVALIKELGATMCAPDERWPIKARK